MRRPLHLLDFALPHSDHKLLIVINRGGRKFLTVSGVVKESVKDLGKDRVVDNSSQLLFDDMQDG